MLSQWQRVQGVWSSNLSYQCLTNISLGLNTSFMVPQASPLIWILVFTTHPPPSHYLLFHFLCLVLPSLLQSFLSPTPPSHGSFPRLCCFVFPQSFDASTSSLPFLSSVSFASLFFLFLSLLVVLVAAPSAHRVCLLLMHLGFANNCMVPYYGSIIPSLPFIQYWPHHSWYEDLTIWSAITVQNIIFTIFFTSLLLAFIISHHLHPSHTPFLPY